MLNYISKLAYSSGLLHSTDLGEYELFPCIALDDSWYSV